ncbi:glycosyl hydrolase [Chitinophaga agrisoli]|uniref:Glycosyl hydrolase n=1 Tax=Chitinophaga agrisoli TaxID=2607653 RepID=A0A5B2VSG8_9BACT|nr:glycoside hydrolase family 38 C-terminal domain-containing protein [Chitinophaga agrisoli]KAA2242713.1 glycosyl hydrolase [Chitinophaga agrisoli]
MNRPLRYKIVTILLLLASMQAMAQQAWYIDGYHGGVWGHYPDWNTRFMADQLRQHPNWYINIEIEPETWDRVTTIDQEAFRDFKKLYEEGRIEYVNPSYAQGYLFNISGESIIRQFRYGIQHLHHYFPQAVFSTYSSEEPCFTSALPQILRSFGFKYASLKNPNTCFGGYTRAHGGELVNWIGPDGSSILTSPRYAVEALSNKSTWQTIAWNNSREYINAAHSAGMQHPVGMTLQDAGWKGGPFKGDSAAYTLWHHYFDHIAVNDKATDWQVSQEDILVSLVWGSQVTQQIAQRVRQAENKILQSEKLAAMAAWNKQTPWPQQALDTAWRTLLLSEHHDCWIVPYNGKPGNTWADKVAAWTTATRRICDSIDQLSVPVTGQPEAITVCNTLGLDRKEVVRAELPKGWNAAKVLDAQGKPVASQLVNDGILFLANVPAMGNQVYHLVNTAARPTVTTAVKQQGSTYILETDLYRITIDTLHGGIIKSLIAKQLHNKELAGDGFNALRGNFYDRGGFRSSMETPVTVQVQEAGALRIKLLLTGQIAGDSFTQTLTVTAGDPKIDNQLQINWKENTGIGQTMAPGTYKWELPAKPFYNDSLKLLALFPSTFTQPHIAKDAPFDVTESQLDNTFYNRWDSIKNNVLLNWVDLTDGSGKYGMALFSDHTTSYAHGENFPLALDIQYSGMGLWGRNYTINGPTAIHYAIVPHASNWEQGRICMENSKWNEPLLVRAGAAATAGQSMFRLEGGAVQVSSVTWQGDELLIRLFNPSRKESQASLSFPTAISSAALVELNGEDRTSINIIKNNRQWETPVTLPPFGIRTIKITKHS